MAKKIKIPDERSTSPEDYEDLVRQGRMKKSWNIGVKQSITREILTIYDGLTWGSIGQIFGYLLGEEDDAFQDVLFKKMRGYYLKTVHGQSLRKKKSAKDNSTKNN